MKAIGAGLRWLSRALHRVGDTIKCEILMHD